MQIYWYKREFNSRRTGLGHRHDHHFIFWETNIAAVTSRGNTLYRMITDVEQLGSYMHNQKSATNAELKR